MNQPDSVIDRAAPPIDRAAQNRALGSVREIWASRAEARTHADLLYLIYVITLSILVFGIPALRMAGAGLARPDVLPALLSSIAPQVAAATLPAAMAVMLLLGATRGPALLAPFFTTTLAGSALPRRRVLWRPFVRALLAPLVGMITVAALVAVTVFSAGHANLVSVLGFSLAGAGAGLLLGAAWLLGEVLGARCRWMVVAALTAAAVGAGLAPQPLLLGAAYPTTPSLAAPAWILTLLLAGLGAVAASVPLLDRLRGRVLLEQALRWEAATTIATTGDLGAAAGTYRARASTGRRLPALGGGPLPWVYARRDAVAWLRTPQRSILGAAAAVLAGAALATGILHTGPLAWCAVGAGTLILWGSSGSFVDGIRHAVHTLGAPPLLGQTAGVQSVLHAIAPTILLAGATVAGALGALAMGADATVLPAPGTVGAAGAAGTAGLTGGAAVLVPLLLAPVLVTARVWNAAKGPMPVQLATPMPTPQGDMSVIPILVWQSDAVLLALASGLVLALLAGHGPSMLAAGALVLIGVVALLARTRFRELRS